MKGFLGIRSNNNSCQHLGVIATFIEFDLVYVHIYAAYDIRRMMCDSKFFLLIYAWLFTCVQVRFATSRIRFSKAIFAVWEKNRMTSEFRCMFTKY